MSSQPIAFPRHREHDLEPRSHGHFEPPAPYGGDGSWLGRRAFRARLTNLYGLAFLVVLVPMWGVVDLWLCPDRIAVFWSIRVVDLLLFLGVGAWLFQRGFSQPAIDLRWHQRVYFGSLWLVVGSIAWMLPSQTEFFFTYFMGFSIVIWGAGLLYNGPLVPAVASSVVVFGLLALSYLAQGTSQSTEELLGAGFFLLGADIIAMGSGVMRYHEQQASYQLASRLRAARERDQRRYALAVQGLGVHVWDWDPVRRVVNLSEGVAQMVGVEHHELSMHEVRQLLHSRLLPVDRVRLTDLVEGGEHGMIEVRIQAGEVRRWIRIRLAGEREHGRLVRVYGAAQDITEQRMRDARKTMFVATMSHELRTPLNGILGMAELMDDAGLPAQYRARLNTIVFSGNHMLNTINDVLDFARIEADAMTITQAEVDIRSMVIATLTMFDAQALERGLTLSCWVEPDVPNEIKTDKTRLSQVLFNLVGNAIKFTENGSVRIEVSRSDGFARIAVHDTGVGIAPDKLQLIFTPFERVENNKNRNTEGQGLGLAIGHRITALLGGRLSCSSTLGVGSEFVVSLPCVRPARTVEPRLAGMHVLVVGLDPQSTRIAERTLLSEGCEVSLSWETLGRDAPTAVLVGEEGVPASRRAQLDRWPQVRVLVLGRGMLKVDPGVSMLQYPLDQGALVLALRSIQPKVEADRSKDPLARCYPMEICVAEDDRVNRMVTVALLEREGYQVAVAEDGLQVVEMVLNRGFELVLMDLHMPHLDGIEATRRIRATTQIAQPYIVAFSADVTIETREACINAGMHDILGKPAGPEALRAMLERSYHAIQQRPKGHAQERGSPG